MPGNSWPHDMVIAVEDDPNGILELLFIRSAWKIAPGAAIPALEPEPDPGASAPPPTAGPDEWGERWRRAWRRAWDWYSIRDPRQGPTPELLRTRSRPGRPLHPASPPSWQAEHGEEGIDRDALARWRDGLRPKQRLPLDRQPERVCLPALVEAWRAGLELVIELPYAGHHARRLSPRHLVVSRATRADPDLYGRALASAPSAGE